MKYFLVPFLLLVISCNTPKKDVKKTTPVKEEQTETLTKPVEEVVKPSKEVKESLLLVIKDSDDFDKVKELVTGNGLTWDKLLFDKNATKVGVISVPAEKRDFWINNLQESGMFTSIEPNTEASAKTIEREIERTFIRFRKTACSGHCPEYKVTINKKGKVVYNGIKYVRVTGRREFQLTEKELTKLRAKLARTNFKNFRKSYNNPSITAVPSTFIQYDNKEILLRVWKNVPTELAVLSEYIEDLLIARKLYDL